MSDFYNVWRAISQQETNNELSVTSNKQQVRSYTSEKYCGQNLVKNKGTRGIYMEQTRGVSRNLSKFYDGVFM